MKKMQLLADIHEGDNITQDEVMEEMVSDGQIARSSEVTMVFDDGKHVGWK